MTLVTVRDVHKTFYSPAGPYTALQGVNLTISAGEYVAIVGRSGSGKSTLLNLIAGLDQVTCGEVTVNGASVHQMNEHHLARYRAQHVGVVFQFFQLLPSLTVAENVHLAMDFSDKIPPNKRTTRALALLARVGLQDHANKFPDTLSGGEQQRVAIARALANDPALILADEPTGNLDSATSTIIHTLFAELVAEGRTIIEVTHEAINAQGFTRVIHLADGQVRSC